MKKLNIEEVPNRECPQKVRETQGALVYAIASEGTVQLPQITQSTECDPGCAGPEKVSRQIGNLTVPLFTKAVCPEE